jgi:serine/threonine protein kinase
LIALADLASAVECVHNFVDEKIDHHLIGLHHDLRPKNILVSENSFILADFGLSKFQRISDDSGNIFKTGIGDYIAPECKDIGNHFEKSRIGRSSDIWSLGCIFAEIATFVALQSSGVLDFRRKRKFTLTSEKGPARTFSLFHRGPLNENEAVTEWLEDLDTITSKPIRLLISLVRKMLSLNQDSRPNAKEVTSALQMIALYALSGVVEVLFAKV